MAWLRDLRWPVDPAVLDGEAVAGDGHEGIQSVFEARGRADGAMAFVAFDVIQVDGVDVMGEPWTHRRKRLADIFAGAALPASPSSRQPRTRPRCGTYGSRRAAARA
jgi:ATP-dependent DNA ligase